MHVFTMRVSDENYQYLKDCAEAAGVSMNTVAETMIDACRQKILGVIRTTGAQVVEPE